MSETREFRCYGPPGTGKTTWLARQAQNAAQKHGGSGVVIASLTRAAAAEIAGRDTPVPEKNVGTLHSHAFHALGRPKIAESSEGIKAWNETCGSPALKITDKRSTDPENAPLEATYAGSDGERLLSAMGVYRQRMTPVELWRSEVKAFARKWGEFKATTGFVDFTDLIEQAIEDVDEHPEKPAVFLLDEAQDMSMLEMTLARKWGAHSESFVIVGDPDQNLYEWRGSDPQAFSAVEAEGTKVLAQSYRVPRGVHDYAVGWIERIEGRAPIEYAPRDFDGSVGVKAWTWQYPEPLVRDLLADAEAGRSVMVLATCGYHLNPLVKVLRAEGVPFHNPYRKVHGGWNPLRYADRVLSFLRPDAETYGDAARFWTWREVAKWTEPLKAQGTMTRGSKSLIEAKLVEDRFGNQEQADNEVAAATLFGLFLDEHHEPIYDVDLQWLLSKCRATRRHVVEYPIAVAQARGRRALLEEPQITVGTIHSVKGGQADSVYVFPDLSRQGAEAWNFSRSGRDAIRRQFYVAFTRARERLALLAPTGSDYAELPRP